MKDQTDPRFATAEPPPHVKRWQARRRGEEIVTRFKRLWPEFSRRQRGLPEIDVAARRSLEYFHDAELKPLRDYGKQLQLWKMEVALDLKTRGVEARQWYAATLPDELAWMLPAEPIGAASVVTPRRSESSGRPAVRGASRRASARSGGSGSDDGEPSEPPAARRLCACGCGEGISHRAPQARYLNDQSSSCHSSHDASQSLRNCRVPSMPGYIRCSGQPRNFDMSQTKSEWNTSTAGVPVARKRS